MNENTRAKMIKAGEKAIVDGTDCIEFWGRNNEPALAEFWTRYVKAYRNAVAALQAGTDVTFETIGDGSEAYRLTISNTKITRECVVNYTVDCYTYDIKRYELALKAFGNPAIAAVVELFQTAEKKMINSATWAAGTKQRGWSNWVSGR